MSATPPHAVSHGGAGPRRKLRVLCLHSWRTSAAIFRAQFARARLLPELEDLMDLTFIDAPHAARGPAPPDVREVFGGEGPFREWFTTRGAEDDISRFELTYEGLEESEAYVERVIREQGPFDGLIGFSQGAIMAAVMAAMQRAGIALVGAPPIRFCILFGAAFSSHPRHLGAMANGRVPVPTCHIIGHQDFVKEHSVRLVRQFDSPIVICHPRGHVIPALAGPQLAVLRAFLTAMQEGADGGGSGGGGGGGGGAAAGSAGAGAAAARSRL